MVTFHSLLSETQKFFSLYWNPAIGDPPKWSNAWLFNSTIPNHDKRGCYALFNEDEIIYIGIGIGKSFGKYESSGLGDRLKRYWKINKTSSDKMYEPTDDWKEVTSIITIGFEEEHFPLAAALEIYLINKLNPARNTQHK